MDKLITLINKKSKVSISIILSLPLSLYGSNVIEGAEMDIQQAGKVLENSVKRNKKPAG